MLNEAVDLPQVKPKVFKHRAFYHAVSKQRWTVFQKREMQFWKQPRTFRLRKIFAKRFYVPALKPWIAGLGVDAQMLEIGSGPICVIQHFPQKKYTYVDPLLDFYRRQFPAVMPENATYITAMAEKVGLPADTFAIVVCLNTLSDVHNPELVLNKVGQVLKTGGLFIVSIDVWPSWLARAHFFLSRLAPTLPRINRLYSYTLRGFSNTLSRHFDIVESQRLQTSMHWLSLKKEYIFICKLKE